jgi:hypothetical protein
MLLRLALLAFAATVAGSAQAADTAPTLQQRYSLCTFAPTPGKCTDVYREALHSSTLAAGAVRDAYNAYARYLTAGAGHLTSSDTSFLKSARIDVPRDLTAVQINGLHNVLNDPSIKDRGDAANNFIVRAEEANIYCGMNACNGYPGT